MKRKFLVILSIFVFSSTLISCDKGIEKTNIESEVSENSTSEVEFKESDDNLKESDDNLKESDDMSSTVKNTEEEKKEVASTDNVTSNTKESKDDNVTSNIEAINTNNDSSSDTDTNTDTNNTNTDTNNTNTNANTEPAIVVENKEVRLYFYNVVSDTIVYYDDIIEVTDKALTNALINALKYPSNSSVSPLLPESINVVSAKLDREHNLFTLDFPSNFLSQFNLGSGAEINTLRSIVNTIGYNFKVDNVIITLGEKPYNSGHISMSSGESFQVSFDRAVKL